jgi:arabinogalactan oligomer / maltooligosaccharide transport system permease protein
MNAWSRSASLGLGVAAAVVLALSAWLFSSVGGDLAAQQLQRSATLLTNAMAQSVAGAEPAVAAERLARWKSAHPEVEGAVLVIGREMAASTRREDEAPRALRREEKPLFDLANELRAAGETNVGDGAVTKKTVRVDDRRDGFITVSVPYQVDGKAEGMLQVRTKSAGQTAAPGGVWGFGLGLLAAAFAVGAFLRIQSERRFDIGRGLAVMALIVLAVVFQQHRIGSMAEVTAANDQAAAAIQTQAAATYAATGAAPLQPSEASPWDTDAYGRPLGLLSPDGKTLAKAAVATDSHLSFLKNAFIAINLLGLLVLAYFVQGYAASTVKAFRENATAYAYIAPAMIGMLVLVFFPFFYGIALAFTDTTLFNEQTPFRERWIGLDNFWSILGDFDIVKTTAEGTVVNYANFYWTLMMTVIWTITNIIIGVSFGFVLALALNVDGLKGKTIYRVLLILPWAIPNYITALVWRGMFHPQFGVVNQFLQMFGMEPVGWFDGVVSSFLTALATNGWLSFPFMMVVILGALQSISKDMYEAAEVEGASRWQQFKGITLPLLRPTLIPAVVLSVVWTFNQFNVIYLVNVGEPGGANEILITKAYKIAFEQYQYAYAAAYSTVIFVILLVYGYFQTRITRATESY